MNFDYQNRETDVWISGFFVQLPTCVSSGSGEIKVALEISSRAPKTRLAEETD